MLVVFLSGKKCIYESMDEVIEVIKLAEFDEDKIVYISSDNTSSIPLLDLPETLPPFHSTYNKLVSNNNRNTTKNT